MREGCHAEVELRGDMRSRSEAARTCSSDGKDHPGAHECCSASMLCCGIALLMVRCWCAEKDAEGVERNHKHAQASSKTYALPQHCIIVGTSSLMHFIKKVFTFLLYSAKTILGY